MRLPILMLIVSYTLIIITDIIIIKDLRVLSLFCKYKPKDKKPGVWWKIYLVFSLTIFSILTVAICLPRRDANIGITTPMWLLYIVISVLVAQIVYSIVSICGLLPTLFKKPRWNTGLWIGLPLSILFLSMMWWGVFVGRHIIQTNQVLISSSKLPRSFNNYKIAQISDLHVGTWGNDTTFISTLVDSVNNLQPDLILFTGDIVNRTADELKPFLHTLSRLKARDGVLSVLGNHDYGDYTNWNSYEDKKNNLDSLKEYQKLMGWRLLNNTHLTITSSEGDSIIIIGVENWGEPPFSKYGDLKKAYPAQCLADENFKILMSHNPEHWNQEVSQISNIDLTLAGHTHAMQIMFSMGNYRWSPSAYKYDQWGGLYSRNKNGFSTKIYVNIGAGEVGMPMRIGAPAEITLLTLICST